MSGQTNTTTNPSTVGLLSAANRRRIVVLLGLAVSVGLLWAAFRGLNPAEVLASLRAVDVPLLLAGMALYYVAMLVITWRWQFLLRAIRPVPLGALYQLVAVGYMGNNVYPFRSGEILRIVLLRRDHGVPLARGTTTVLVERVFDGLVMLTFIVVPLGLLAIPNVAPEIRAVAGLTAPLFLGALAAFLFLAARPGLLRRLVALVARPLPGKLRGVVGHLSEEFIAGLEGLRSPRDVSGALFASYLTWMIETLVYWIVALAFGLEVSYPMMLMVVGVVNLAGLLPASPGQVGVFEFFVSRALIGFGVAETPATAYALLVHIAIWIPPTLLGFICLARLGLGFSAIAQASQGEVAALAATEAESPEPGAPERAGVTPRSS